MKFLINAGILDNKPVGLGIYTNNVSKELAKLLSLNNEITIVTSCPEFIREYRVEIMKSPKLIQHKYGKCGGILRYLFNQTCLFNKAKKFDIVYSPTHHGILFIDNQIITVHDLLPLHFKNIFKRQSLAYYYYRFFLEKILSTSRAVITPTDNTKKDLLKFFRIRSSKIFVVPNGINHKLFLHRENASSYVTNKYGLRDYILNIGCSSYPYKNLKTLLKAYSCIGIAERLVVVGGRRDYVKELFNLSIKLGIKKRIVFLSYIPQEDVPYLYTAAKVFVYPSLYEGFGFPPLEAMACGCPVIVSNTSSLPEVCGNAAYYVDPYSVDSIAEGIYKVLTDEDLRKTFIERGLERVKILSWENTAKRILKVFEEVLHS